MADPSTYRVLLVGYRSGLVAALRSRGIAFALWDQKSRGLPDAAPELVLPLTASLDKLREYARQFREHGPFTHVIACTEKAVVTASIARRVLGARLSPQSTIIRCHDKLLMKEELARSGVPMTAFLRPRPTISSQALVDTLGQPVVLKDRASSGGRDIYFAADAGEVEAHRKGQRIAEKYIDAPELSVESFVHEGRVLFTNVTDYLVKKYANLLPARMAAPELAALLALNAQVIASLKIEWGMTHMETYRTPAGFLFGEIALRPPGGYIMELLTRAYGFDAWQAFLAVELGEEFKFPPAPLCYAVASIIHPGAGQVTAIEGLDALKQLPSLVKVKIKLAVGQELSRREGVGEDYGYYIQTAQDYDELMAAWQQARQSLQIHLAAKGLTSAGG